MFKFLKILISFVLVVSMDLSVYAQVKVIDQKGSLKQVDTSKWFLSGIHVFNKNSGNVGIGTSNPQTKLHINGTIRFQGLGSNTSNNSILTTDGSGNVTTRTLTNLLSGNAITSLNGLTGSVQTLIIGSTGVDFNISSTETTHTFNLPTASSTNRGLLSSSDWTNFNAKLNSSLTNGNIFVGNVSNIATPVAMSGDATILSSGALTIANNAVTLSKIQNITASRLLGNPTGLATIPSEISLGTGLNFSGSVLNTVNNGTVTSVTGTLPIVITGTPTTTPNVTITRNNIVSGASSNTATNPLVLDAGATNAVVSGANATLTVNNTAPLWNANQLQGRNIATTAPTTGQLLSWDGTNWTPTTGNASGVSLLVDANRTSTYSPAVVYDTIVYNSASTNVGTVYNTTTGVFTASSSGLYQVVVSNMYSFTHTNNNFASLKVRIIVNGATNIETAGYGNFGNAAPNSNNINCNTFVSLTSGDTLRIDAGDETGTVTPQFGTGQHNLKIIRF